jgi:TetR/AcrR family transcriptional repressor of nem operon
MAGEVPRLGEATRLEFGSSIGRLSGALAVHLSALGREQPQAAASSVVAELVGALAISRAVLDKSQSDLILANSRQSVLARTGLLEQCNES